MEYKKPMDDYSAYTYESYDLDNIIDKISVENTIKLIRSMERGYRDVLLLNHVYNKSMREIAEIIGNTPEAVRKKITRAEKKLAVMIRDKS